MNKAKKKFGRKKETHTEGLTSIEESTRKNEENELLATDNEAGAPASSSMFESIKIEDNVDYTDGGKVT